MPIDDPILPCASKKPAPPENTPKENETHFVEFKVVDDKSAGIKGVRLHVILPGGNSQYVTTDDKGIARIENIEPGDCKIVSNWKSLKVDDTVLIQ